MKRATFALALLLAGPLAAQVEISNPGGVVAPEPRGALADRPACTAGRDGWRWTAIDAAAPGECATNGGASRAECTCRDGEWMPTNTPGPAGPQGPPGLPGDGLPPGAAAVWLGTRSSIPAGWAPCALPEGRFLRLADTGVDAGGTGGSGTHGHAFSDVIEHTHGLQRYPTTSGAQSGFTADISMGGAPAAVTLTTGQPAGAVATGTTEAASSLPAYVDVILICPT